MKCLSVLELVEKLNTAGKEAKLGANSTVLFCIPDGPGVPITGVNVENDPDGSVVYIMGLLVESQPKSKTSPIVTANLIKELMQTGLTIHEAAVRLPVSPSYAASLLKLLKFPVEIQAAIDDGRLPVSHARLIQDRLPELDWRTFAIFVIGSGISLKVLHSLINEWKHDEGINELES